MCSTCGCGEASGSRVTLLNGEPPEEFSGEPAQQHSHPHDGHQDHHHGHGDKPGSAGDHRHDEDGRTVILEQQILAKNAGLAQQNRRWLEERRIFTVNLMSSPGSGKTTLLEQTISAVAGRVEIAVIEGDQETPLDALRIRASGRPVVQINTGAGCHLDAEMVHRALRALDPAPGSLLFIENVGNLVCPALFDLGEAKKVILASVTEGSDKPLKYPQMFAAADLVLINKMDLLPYVNFDLDRFRADVRQVNAAAELVTITATDVHLLAPWLNWLNNSLSGNSSVGVLDNDLSAALEL